MSLKIFYDLLSQPSRSVLMFARANKIPYTPCPIATRKFEHQSKEYAAINPFMKVPAIQDGEFCLTESMAITKYLHKKYDCPDHWYPSKLVQRARVDEYLDWHHTFTRPYFGKVILGDLIMPMITGNPPDREALKPEVKKMEKTLDGLESYFLKDKPFICSDEISIADISCVNEARMLDLTSYDPLKNRPKLREWIERVRQRLDPEMYDDVMKIVYRIQYKK